MTRPLRVVQIVPYPILPASAGGKVRIVQLARALCRLGVEVTIITPYHLTQKSALAAREPFTLHQVPYAPFALPFLFTDRPFPYGVLASFHPGYRALLPVELGAFDICQIDHPAFGDLASAVPPSVPVVYGSQNVEFDYVSAECRRGIVRRIAGARVRNLEDRLLRRATHVFACTGGDSQRFTELYGTAPDRISIIPNGIDLSAVDAAVAAAGRRRRGRILRVRRAVFAGSDVAHNRAAVAAIVGQLAPRLKDEFEFIIIGPCARSVRDRPRPNVRLDPEGDVAHYAGPGSIALNPVVAGSGSSLKLLYYLACNLPVVTTPFGMRGVGDLSPWVVTAELGKFAEAMRANPRLPTGVRTALARYEWRSVAGQAVAAYAALAGRGAAHRVAC
jgi:hypothetical protein